MTASLENDNSGEEKTNKVRNLAPSDYVGFDCLPEQYVSRTIRNGIVFNILVVGATGVGKSTLIDSLFNTRFPDVSTRTHNRSCVELNVQVHELKEKQIRLRLAIAETRGYGDQINKGIVSLYLYQLSYKRLHLLSILFYIYLHRGLLQKHCRIY